jgi:hypothetical protein
MLHQNHKEHSMSQPSWQAAGVVEAPVDRVWEALLATHTELTTADRRAIAEHRAPQPLVLAPRAAEHGRITVDPGQRWIATEGAWWYRGVLTVERQAESSLLSYRVANIAPGSGRWIAQLVQAPAHVREMPATLQRLLTAIGIRLGVATQPVRQRATRER